MLNIPQNRKVDRGLPRTKRLLKRCDFLRVQSRGSFRAAGRFTVVFVAHSDVGPRLGVVASKRVGNAVVRNRAKRLAREAFRIGMSGREDRLDVVVMMKAGGQPTLDSVMREVVAAVDAFLRR